MSTIIKEYRIASTKHLMVKTYMVFTDFAQTMNIFLQISKSALAFVDIVLMQMQKFFWEYSHGDLTANVLPLQRFVPYGSSYIIML